MTPGSVATLPPPLTELERWESYTLGLDLRRHPLDAYAPTLQELGVTPAKEIRTLPHGTNAVAAGVLETLQAPPTRSGALVHFLLTEDPSGLLQSTIFENTYRSMGTCALRERSLSPARKGGTRSETWVLIPSGKDRGSQRDAGG